MADLGSFLGAAGLGGGAIGAAVVRLQLDSRQYEAELAKQKGVTTASANSMGSAWTKYGAVVKAGAVAAGAAVVAFAVKSIQAASDLNEQINRARVTFGAAAGSVISFSETTASTLGIAQAQALEAASGFGAMAQAAGLSESAAAKMSTELVTLAADLASFNNQDPSEMLERLRSGLAGEAEPLRRFGIFISEAAVKTEAYAAGIAKAGTELTDAQKIQARYNIILRDSEKAQGDFARTLGESLPNQIRVLKAEFIDLSAKIGQDLLPAALEFLKIIKQMVEALEPLLSNLGKVAWALEKWGSVVTKIMSPLGTAIGFFSKFTGEIQLTREEVNALADALDIEDRFQALQRGLDDADKYAAAFIGRVDEFLPVLTRASEGTDDLADSTGKLARQQERAEARAEEHAETLKKELAKAIESAQDAVGGAIGTLENVSRQWNLTGSAAVKNAQIMAEKADDLRRAYKELDRDAVPPNFKKWLIQQGPEAVRAYTQANEDGKRDIIAAWRSIRDDLKATNASIKRIMKEGGDEAGSSFTTGLATGIREGIPGVEGAARDAAKAAVLAAKRALEAWSPSKVMEKLGEDFMLGFEQGITKSEERAARAAERAFRHLVRVAERMLASFTRVAEREIAKLEDELDRWLRRAEEMSGAVMSGFGSLLGIGGAVTGAAGEEPFDIRAYFQEQLATAQQFADVLKALQAQGASAELLQQIAAAGPEAIPFAQQLLQMGPAGIAEISGVYEQIGALAESTGKALSEAYFGEQIAGLRSDLKEQRQELRDQTRLMERAIRILERPQRLQVSFSGVSTNALEKFILDVVRNSNLVRAAT